MKLERKERKCIEKLGATLNSQPTRTDTEYREANKDEKRKYESYYQENKETKKSVVENTD
jgi:hypothetical protein